MQLSTNVNRTATQKADALSNGSSSQPGMKRVLPRQQLVLTGLQLRSIRTKRTTTNKDGTPTPSLALLLTL